MTTDHYPNLHRRAERLTLLERDGQPGRAEDIARRTIRLAFGSEHGIEGFTVPTGALTPAIQIAYVNRGDTYDETLVRTENGWIVSCWGDALEAAEETYAAKTGEQRCAYCSEWTDYVDQENDYRGTCCGAIDPESLDVADILEGAARALFVSAYADAADEAGEEFDGDRAGSGEDWMDVAPETPEAATISATMLLARTAALAASAGNYELNEPTDSIMCGLCKDWIDCGGNSIGHNESAEEVFGHYLAMQALGHGVGLSDDTDGGYKSPTLPFCESSYRGGEFWFDIERDEAKTHIPEQGTARDAEKKLAHKLFETGEKAVRNAEGES